MMTCIYMAKTRTLLNCITLSNRLRGKHLLCCFPIVFNNGIKCSAQSNNHLYVWSWGKVDHHEWHFRLYSCGVMLGPHLWKVWFCNFFLCWLLSSFLCIFPTKLQLPSTKKCNCKFCVSFASLLYDVLWATSTKFINGLVCIMTSFKGFYSIHQSKKDGRLLLAKSMRWEVFDAEDDPVQDIRLDFLYETLMFCLQRGFPWPHACAALTLASDMLDNCKGLDAVHFFFYYLNPSVVPQILRSIRIIPIESSGFQIISTVKGSLITLFLSREAITRCC